jgi:hypothetical protein
MGDIPGLDFESLVAIDRSTLPNWDARPEVRRHEFNGRVTEHLSWNYEQEGEEVSSSSSPAQRLAFRTDDPELATPTILQRLWESLEVPGTSSDYHFLLQGAATSLWGRRCADPDVLEQFEKLCWLDIRLLQTVPEAVRNEYADEGAQGSGFYRVAAFGSLIDFYSLEGFLDRAMEVARLAEGFGQGEDAIRELRERLAALEAEDAA